MCIAYQKQFKFGSFSHPCQWCNYIVATLAIAWVEISTLWVWFNVRTCCTHPDYMWFVCPVLVWESVLVTPLLVCKWPRMSDQQVLCAKYYICFVLYRSSMLQSNPIRPLDYMVLCCNLWKTIIEVISYMYTRSSWKNNLMLRYMEVQLNL